MERSRRTPPNNQYHILARSPVPPTELLRSILSMAPTPRPAPPFSHHPHLEVDPLKRNLLPYHREKLHHARIRHPHAIQLQPDLPPHELRIRLRHLSIEHK